MFVFTFKNIIVQLNHFTYQIYYAYSEYALLYDNTLHEEHSIM